MGALEVAALTVAKLVTSAAAAFCKVGAANTTNVIGKAGYTYGGALANALYNLAAAGMSAALAEFTATQTAESAFVSAAKSIPPIT